jgi:hypothetical protein
MLQPAELVTSEPVMDVIAPECKAFWLELELVNFLGGDIVTIQRDGELIGAYHSLDARTIRFAMGLAPRPHTDGPIPMGRTNWESALAGSSGMGQVYASDSCACYLSRWEFGLGVSADRTREAGWFDQRIKLPQEPCRVASQIKVSIRFGSCSKVT